MPPRPCSESEGGSAEAGYTTMCMIKRYCMYDIYWGVLKLRDDSRGPWRSSPMNNSQY